MNIDSVRYARGFAIAACELSAYVPSHWHKTQVFSSLHLAHDPRVPMAISSSGNTVLFGHAVAVPTGEFELMVVCENVDRNIGSVEFESYVNSLCGRFSLIVRREDGIWLRQDATGMRSVFYSQTYDGVVAATNMRLAGAIANRELSTIWTVEWIDSTHQHVMPGRVTPMEDVYALTPSTEIELNTGKIRRFYFGPEQPRSLSVSEAADILIENAHSQVPFLCAQQPVRLPLTSGFDSRTTLALLKDTALEFDAFTVTNRSVEGLELERAVAQEIAHRLGIKHRALEVQSLDDFNGEILDVLVDNLVYGEIKSPITLSIVPVEFGGMYLWSNIYELGTVAYRQRTQRYLTETTTMTPEVAQTIRGGGKPSDTLQLAAWEDFLTVTEFDSLRMDHFDALFIEHRMGVWRQNVYIEGDSVRDIHTLINHRPTLEAMCSVPFIDRWDHAVQIEIFERLLPELSDIPINGTLRQRGSKYHMPWTSDDNPVVSLDAFPTYLGSKQRKFVFEGTFVRSATIYPYAHVKVPIPWREGLFHLDIKRIGGNAQGMGVAITNTPTKKQLYRVKQAGSRHHAILRVDGDPSNLLLAVYPNGIGMAKDASIEVVVKVEELKGPLVNCLSNEGDC